MSGEVILVVDDNPTNLKLASISLRKVGYDVRTAVDGPSAVAALQQGRPALILLDLQLPGVDGLELTRRWKADPRLTGIPVLALTASVLKEDEERARDAGCDDYLTKPIEPAALRAAVERTIRTVVRGGDGGLDSGETAS